MQFLVVLLADILALTGCNRPPQETYPSEGVVKWTDGTPAAELAQGRVELQVLEGPAIRVSPRGNVQNDATFVLQTYEPNDGAPAGKYRAVIIPWAPPVDSGPALPLPIDSRWQNFQTTPLSVTIEPKPNQIVLTVERAARR